MTPEDVRATFREVKSRQDVFDLVCDFLDRAVVERNRRQVEVIVDWIQHGIRA